MSPLISLVLLYSSWIFQELQSIGRPSWISVMRLIWKIMRCRDIPSLLQRVISPWSWICWKTNNSHCNVLISVLIARCGSILDQFSCRRCETVLHSASMLVVFRPKMPKPGSFMGSFVSPKFLNTTSSLWRQLGLTMLPALRFPLFIAP